MKKKHLITCGAKIELVPEDEILCCKSDNCYTTIFLESGEELISCKSLNKLHSEFVSRGFLRISRSCVVNLNFVKAINKKEKTLELNGKLQVPFTVGINELLMELSTVLINGF
ncbi:LytR/AlgR family response regulator transcription factor [Pelobium manganitolerans]|uniref:LytR/AlgR family response regulator transcription factor n=1 Tax=Pelobium manganitolerans TaxID=1842495 RepID=UPI003FA3D2FD